VPISRDPLRPQDRCGGLFHRKQGNQAAQQQAADSGDDGDDPRNLLSRSLITVVGHEGRSYATLLGVLMRQGRGLPDWRSCRDHRIGATNQRRSGAGLHRPLRVTEPRSSRAGAAFG
jgi:hypothetical protein